MTKKKILIHVLGSGSLGHIRLGEMVVYQLSNCFPGAELILVSENNIRPFFKNSDSIRDNCKFIKLKHKKIIKNNQDESLANNGGNLYQYHTNLDEIILKYKPDTVFFLALFPSQVLNRIKNLHNKNILVTWAYKKEQWEIFLNNNYDKYFDTIYLIDLDKPKIEYRENIHYIGPIMPYVNKKTNVSKYLFKKYKLDRNKFTILITVGGGGFSSAGNVLNNINNIIDKFDSKIRFIIISGPFYQKFKILEDQWKNVIVEKYEPYIFELMSHCRLVISEAGYNTINEIITTSTPAILIPGFRNNDDQQARAKFLKRGAGVKVIDNIEKIPAIITKYIKNSKELLKIKKRLSDLQLLKGNDKLFDKIIQLDNNSKEPVVLKVSDACNNNCIYCKLLDIKNKRNKSFNEIKRELGRIKENGTVEVIFPCNTDNRSDFLEIIKYTKSLAFKIKLRTNGRIFIYKTLAKMAVKYIDSFEVFLNSTEKEINLKICLTDSLKQTVYGIRNLIKLKANIQIDTVITNYNYKNLKPLILFCAKNRLYNIWLIYPVIAKNRSRYIPEISESSLYIDNAFVLAKDDNINIITGKLFNNSYINNDLILDYDLAEVKHKKVLDHKQKQISVVVPTYNRKGLLYLTLLSLFYQNYSRDKYEIIVVDDGSDDNTIGMIKKLKPTCNFKYIYWPRSKKYKFGEPDNRAGPARNLGAYHSQGSYLLFWDSDMIAKSDMLKQHFITRPDSNSIVMGTRIMLKKGLLGSLSVIELIISRKLKFNVSQFGELESADRVLQDLQYDVYQYDFPWMLIMSSNLMVARDLFIKFNGFDKNFVFWGAEDSEFAYRLSVAGIKLIINRKAFGYHQFHHKEYVSKNIFVEMVGINMDLAYKKHLDKSFFGVRQRIIELYKQ